MREKIREDLEGGDMPESCLLKLDEVKQHLPMKMQGFSDFYTSLEHCRNVRRSPPVCRFRLEVGRKPTNSFRRK